MSIGQEMSELSDEIALAVRKEYDEAISEDSQRHLNALKRHFNISKMT